MDQIARLLGAATDLYNAGGPPLAAVYALSSYSHGKLRANATWESLGYTEGREYWAFVGPNKSRPVVRKWYIEDPRDFEVRWATVVASIDSDRHVLTCAAEEANSVLYTAVIAVASAFDVWKPTSRKTPGTFFEVLLGSFMSRLLPTYARTKHIPLPLDLGAEPASNEDSVSTDIVFTRPNGSKSLVIPAKITTRERIVQPFAHQRILDSVFGPGRYVSVLTCVSETQRDDRNRRANMICVPGTVRLFQRHLAPLGGIYYLDPPARYLAADMLDVVPVGTVGMLLTNRLPTLA